MKPGMEPAAFGRWIAELVVFQIVGITTKGMSGLCFSLLAKFSSDLV
jgi:hypothetical protein